MTKSFFSSAGEEHEPLVQLLAGWVGVVIYMMAIMLITLVTAIRMPETRGRDLKLVADA